MDVLYFVYFSLTWSPLTFNLVLTLLSFFKVIFSLYMLTILVYVFHSKCFTRNENTTPSWVLSVCF